MVERSQKSAYHRTVDYFWKKDNVSQTDERNKFFELTDYVTPKVEEIARTLLKPHKLISLEKKRSDNLAPEYIEFKVIYLKENNETRNTRACILFYNIENKKFRITHTLENRNNIAYHKSSGTFKAVLQVPKECGNYEDINDGYIFLHVKPSQSANRETESLKKISKIEKEYKSENIIEAEFVKNPHKKPGKEEVIKILEYFCSFRPNENMSYEINKMLDDIYLTTNLPLAKKVIESLKEKADRVGDFFNNEELIEKNLKNKSYLLEQLNTLLECSNAKIIQDFLNANHDIIKNQLLGDLPILCSEVKSKSDIIELKILISDCKDNLSLFLSRIVEVTEKYFNLFLEHNSKNSLSFNTIIDESYKALKSIKKRLPDKHKDIKHNINLFLNQNLRPELAKEKYILYCRIVPIVEDLLKEVDFKQIESAGGVFLYKKVHELHSLLSQKPFKRKCKTNIEKACNALDLIHKNGFYHLDIKLENLGVADSEIFIFDCEWKCLNKKSRVFIPEEINKLSNITYSYVHFEVLKKVRKVIASNDSNEVKISSLMDLYEKIDKYAFMVSMLEATLDINSSSFLDMKNITFTNKKKVYEMPFGVQANKEVLLKEGLKKILCNYDYIDPSILFLKDPLKNDFPFKFSNLYKRYIVISI